MQIFASSSQMNVHVQRGTIIDVQLLRVQGLWSPSICGSPHGCPARASKLNAYTWKAQRSWDRPELSRTSGKHVNVRLPWASILTIRSPGFSDPILSLDLLYWTVSKWHGFISTNKKDTSNKLSSIFGNVKLPRSSKETKQSNHSLEKRRNIVKLFKAVYG